MKAFLLVLLLAATVYAQDGDNGPVVRAAGCWPTDTKFFRPVKPNGFMDDTKKNYVEQAYLQAQVRIAKDDDLMALTAGCDFIKTEAIRGCYNSVVAVGPAQIAGQYGFLLRSFFKCPIPGGSEIMKCVCAARLNTWRDNRAGAPSFWGSYRTACVCP